MVLLQDTTFVFGQLMMPREYLPAAEAAWGDAPLAQALVLAAVVGVVASLRDLYRVAPALLRSLMGRKGCEEAEYNMQTSRTRTWAASVFMLPLALLADRYLAPQSNLPVTMALIAGFLLLRLLIYGMIRYRILGGESFRYAYTCYFTYSLVATAVSLVAVGVMQIAGADDDMVRTVIISVLSAFYFLFLIRKWHFLQNSYRPFTTFLYLCALEFLPLGILAALWVR